MIDLHTHILPYVDDGAADLDMALEMGQYAASKGIRVIAATPHFYQIPDWAKIQSKVANLQKAFLQHQIDVTLVAGAELFMDLDIQSRLFSAFRLRELPRLSPIPNGI